MAKWRALKLLRASCFPCHFSAPLRNRNWHRKIWQIYVKKNSTAANASCMKCVLIIAWIWNLVVSVFACAGAKIRLINSFSNFWIVYDYDQDFFTGDPCPGLVVWQNFKWLVAALDCHKITWNITNQYNLQAGIGSSQFCGKLLYFLSFITSFSSDSYVIIIHTFRLQLPINVLLLNCLIVQSMSRPGCPFTSPCIPPA